MLLDVMCALKRNNVLSSYRGLSKSLISVCLTVEAVCSSDTLRSTLRYNPEDEYQHLQRRENLRFCTLANMATFVVLDRVSNACDQHDARYVLWHETLKTAENVVRSLLSLSCKWRQQHDSTRSYAIRQQH